MDCRACVTLKMIAEKFGGEFESAFTNGGDQNNDTILSDQFLRKLGLHLNMGYTQTQSMQLLINNFIKQLKIIYHYEKLRKKLY